MHGRGAWAGLVSGLLLIGALSCYKGPVPDPVRLQVQSDPAAAVPALEAILLEYPRDFDVRMLLGQAHYRAARSAVDAGDEASYLHHFEQAILALIEAMRLRPGAAHPYVLLGMIDAYRGDMAGARRALLKAIHLQPKNPYNYTNLARVYIFLDQPRRARKLLARALALGGANRQIDEDELFLAWKAGDLVDAHYLFDSLSGAEYPFIRHWDDAPVSAPIRSFDDFAAYCCSNPACGPYMRSACERAQQEVAERELTLETLRREQQIARENQAKLPGVYGDGSSGKRRSSDVTIEADPPSRGAPEDEP